MGRQRDATPTLRQLLPALRTKESAAHWLPRARVLVSAGYAEHVTDDTRPEGNVKRVRVRSLLSWVGRHELGSLMAISAISLGTWVFVEVADEVGEGDAESLDRKLLLSLRTPGDLSDPIGPAWLEEVGRDLTALGGVAGLCLLTIAVVGYLLLARKPRAAVFIIASVTGALVLSLGLKQAFNRPRPDLVPHMSEVLTSSFPSGHSMLSAAVYLTLGALLARLQASLVLKAYVLLWALFLAFLVGVSRVYVGVHWPSDVLAGWAAGASWAALCWLLARALQRRGEVEAPSGTAETGAAEKESDD